ncbi:uncharacterized protein KY384_006748 [Bacidia gigantensis]|uniref:uncharacterized protein n=1 Tax=Bacidia gigantensis TaxID=2732470 RepID=UPI001D0596AB|nr:uncharacterized protein KY384_006748 [Bacidia gigantensis]KAG8527832.1 hypothetical protein KY384_006748 [Bacidia gigantensis]
MSSAGRDLSSALDIKGLSEISFQNDDAKSFYRYTSGRWLWDEQAQLSKRYVHFDLTELKRIAVEAAGASSCVNMIKVGEGLYNKAFLLTMDNGNEVRNMLNIPAPKVYAWSSRRDENPVKAEYIIMEKAPGIELENVWEGMSGQQRWEVLKQVVAFEKKFASTRFKAYGSLYYPQDIPNVTDARLEYTNEDGETQNSEFAVGPSNSRSFFDHGRGEILLDRGPCMNFHPIVPVANNLQGYSAEDYFVASAHREIESIMKLREFPKSQGLFYGPTQYQPTAATKLSALFNYLKVARCILPKEQAMSAPLMWHGDLHRRNIFVDPQKPTEIVSIIDWQAVNLRPILDEQKKAKDLLSKQSLYKLWEVETRRENQDAARALDHQDTLGVLISGLAGSIFTDGEPIITGLLMALEDKWTKVVGTTANGQPTVPWPLNFSAQEKAIQKDHEAQ